MLVLSRREHERIAIGSDITITIIRIRGNVVRIGIDAPADMSILRGEVFDDIASGKRRLFQRDSASGGPPQ